MNPVVPSPGGARQCSAGSPTHIHFREMRDLMGLQAGQAPLGLEGPLDGLVLMVFQESLVLW